LAFPAAEQPPPRAHLGCPDVRRGPWRAGPEKEVPIPFLGYAVLILTSREFRYVGWDYLVTLVILLALGLDFMRRGEPAAGFVVAGVLVSATAALAQYLRISPHPWFNHNDVYHVIQTAGVWLFFRAGLLLHDR
jgi:hypothetical protein